MNTYPTKEEILAKEPKFSKRLIYIIEFWKMLSFDNRWDKADKIEKQMNLALLIYRLTENKPIRDYIPSTRYAYDPIKRAIYVDRNHPSIISTLHELGHHFKGPSELQACRWSVWLFKRCFPEQFKKLKWKGHMLVSK